MQKKHKSFLHERNENGLHNIFVAFFLSEHISTTTATKAAVILLIIYQDNLIEWKRIK